MVWSIADTCLLITPILESKAKTKKKSQTSTREISALPLIKTEPDRRKRIEPELEPDD